MRSKRIIIGLVGEPSGGKDTAADYLVKKYNFEHISTGDLVREYITKNKLGNLTRKNLKKNAIKLREQFGSDYLANIALQNAKSNNVVISGLRTIPEAHSIQLNKGIVLCVNADIRTRYQRAKARGRVGENIDFESFKKTQLSEERGEGPHEQNVEAVMSIADQNISNDGTLEDLHKQLDEFMSHIFKQSQSN
ncbi:MAG TPA: nucleoside monophosphate kinase [Candidatus Saccharibacteria bacterium]|nr:nucleoside monophosphate kinase [Candidatus Saccharibacteria bacterium]HMT39628.1 nucleoside monophosphate kinase [Candidatus Saccharibacteria bacterium]